jgi:hypothetical protein
MIVPLAAFKSEVETRVAFMRSLGVRHMNCGGLDLELGPAPDPAQTSAPSTPAELAEVLPDALPPDDALFWSVSGPLPSEVSDSSRPPEE